MRNYYKHLLYQSTRPNLSLNQRFKMADASENGVTKDFSKVVLTLRNVLIPCERLTPTPSTIDGLDAEIETDLRILGCELIQTAGILLKLPQVSLKSR